MSTSRSYRSELREQRAEETRLRIREAAADLFASRGFSETTVAAIAEQAGVAAPTVYATFGSKAGIVLEMLRHLEETADMGQKVAEMMSETDPYRQLELFTTWIRTLWEGGSPILRAALAAKGDPDVAAMSGKGDAGRRAGAQELCEIFSAKGMLRPSLDPTAAADQLWLLTNPDLYFYGIDRLDWTPDQYEEWLGGLLERELLQPRPD